MRSLHWWLPRYRTGLSGFSDQRNRCLFLEGTIERKWIEELPVPKKLAFCLRQCSFVADASPIQPDRVDLMLDQHLGCFCLTSSPPKRKGIPTRAARRLFRWGPVADCLHRSSLHRRSGRIPPLEYLQLQPGRHSR